MTAGAEPTGKLTGRVAMVTGGGSGIGRASCLALAAEGAHVLAADIDLNAADQTVAELRANGASGVALGLDVTSEESWAETVERVEAEGCGLNILVNNAGISLVKPIQDFSLADWKRQVSLNLDSVFLGTRAFLSVLAQARGGTIINVASSAGRQGVPLMAGYCATKAGVINFTKAMALECSQLGIPVRINVVSPGSVATPLWMKLGNDGVMPEGGINPDVMDAMRSVSAKITPIGFPGEAEDVAKAIVYMASDDARFMFGGELVIDGGNSAGTATMPSN